MIFSSEVICAHHASPPAHLVCSLLIDKLMEKSTDNNKQECARGEMGRVEPLSNEIESLRQKDKRERTRFGQKKDKLRVER